MSTITKIAWTDSTVNFWSGCTKASAGCANCYAEARDRRQMIEKVIHFGPGAPRLKHKGAVKDALRLNRKPWVCACGESFTTPALHDCSAGRYDVPWNQKMHRRRVFSLSLGDWLDPEVPIEWLAEMLDTIRQCDQVTWILCTKRPELFRERLLAAEAESLQETGAPGVKLAGRLTDWLGDWRLGNAIPSNIWLLTTAENQEMADKRIPELLKIPAVAHGLSCEPLLGPLDFSAAFKCGYYCSEEHGHVDHPFASKVKAPIDWVITGGESGPGARPCKTEWIRGVVQQCQAAGVPCFVKQMGAYVVDRNDAGFEGDPGEWPMDTHTEDLDPGIYQGAPVRVLLNHPKGGDPAEWPEDLRVQEWPKEQ